MKKKIHKVLSFHQSPWMRPYINFCCEQRKLSSSNFQKDFWKLMMNSVFGKSMENVRERIRLELVSNPEKALKLFAKPNFKQFIKFNDNFTAIELYKTKVCLNKPIYIGQTILDLSKLYMFDFHYNYFSKQYDNYKLLFTDTDSFCYYVETKDIYEDLFKDKQLFDFSNYHKNSKYVLNENKNVIGKFKDEFGGEIVKEFVGLRPKLYSILSEKDNKKAIKGVKTSISKNITHENYKQCLFSKYQLNVDYNILKNYHHSISIKKQTKIALSAFDDKRYVLKAGIYTLAYGHYDVKKYENVI